MLQKRIRLCALAGALTVFSAVGAKATLVAHSDEFDSELAGDPDFDVGAGINSHFEREPVSWMDAVLSPDPEMDLSRSGLTRTLFGSSPADAPAVGIWRIFGPDSPPSFLSVTAPNLYIESVTPEPASAALLVTALLAFAVLLRRHLGS